MVFIELTPFREFAAQHWQDEDLSRLQSHLIEQPGAGALIPGAHGLRKLRWSVPGKGKRGGARVIYYWIADKDRIYLVHAYAKSATADLTRKQIQQLAVLVRSEVV